MLVNGRPSDLLSNSFDGFNVLYSSSTVLESYPSGHSCGSFSVVLNDVLNEQIAKINMPL